MKAVNAGTAFSYSVAPHSSYPATPLDLIESGDSDWSAGASSTLAARARANQIEAHFSGGYVGWLQSTGATVAITNDLGAAKAADRLILKGYHGSDLIYRPTAVKVEHSDNGTDWVEHQNLTGLTGGGQPGVAQWYVAVDVSGEVHRYWRATLTHGGAFLFVSTFELTADWVNHAEGRAYTISPSADANFPNNVPMHALHSGDTDWSTTAGKLTSGDRGWPGSFGTGVGWLATGTARLDLGSAMGGDHFVVHGINGSGTSMRTPTAVDIEYSDNDTDWVSVLSKSGLTVEFNAKGRWIAQADISAAGEHRYWRAKATQSVGFVTMTQIELWASVSEEPEEPVDTEGAVSWAEFEVPSAPRRVSVAQVEVEVPTAPRKLLVAWAELEAPTAPRSADVSWAELETPTAPRTVSVSWAELEAPIAPRSLAVSWAELEAPEVVVEPRGAEVSWAEVEVPVAGRKAVIAWAEAEVPVAPRSATVTHAVFEVPSVPRSAEVAWAELETPDAARRAVLAFVEVEAPTAPRSAQIAHATLEAPLAPRSGRVAWVEFEVPSFERGAVVAWAEFEIPGEARRLEVSHLVFESPGQDDAFYRGDQEVLQLPRETEDDNVDDTVEGDDLEGEWALDRVNEIAAIVAALQQ